MMEISEYKEATVYVRDVWRYAGIGCGVQCVIMAGILMMLQLFADSWAMLHMVSSTCLKTVGLCYTR